MDFKKLDGSATKRARTPTDTSPLRSRRDHYQKPLFRKQWPSTGCGAFQSRKSVQGGRAISRMITVPVGRAAPPGRYWKTPAGKPSCPLPRHPPLTQPPGPRSASSRSPLGRTPPAQGTFHRNEPRNGTRNGPRNDNARDVIFLRWLC